VSRIAAWSLVAALSLAACTASSPTEPSPEPTAATDAEVVVEDVGGVSSTTAEIVTRPVRLVALGDSYTHGTETRVPRRDSWPAQLKESLERRGYSVDLRNLAEPSVSSLTLLEEQLGQVESLHPDVVTLQVGANDIIAGDYASQRDYRDNITVVFDELLTFLPSERILAITTPDHTLAESGQPTDSADTGRALVEELNATLRDVAREREIEVIDIGPVNSLAAQDSTLVVQEDPPLPYPYPTAKQYAAWAEVIGPYVHEALSTLEP
jgi:lysophospholipase L1-like esterase